MKAACFAPSRLESSIPPLGKGTGRISEGERWDSQSKVCMISATWPDLRCGVGDFAARLSESIDNEGANVSVITSSDRRIKSHSSGARNIAIFGIVEKWNFAALPSILRKISSLQPDVVHIQYETHMYGQKSMINFLPLVARLMRFPCTLIVTLHEFEGPTLFSSKGILGGMGPKALVRFLLSRGLTKDLKLRALIRGCDSVIVTNEAQLNHLTKEFSAQRRKFIRILLGASLPLTQSPGFNQQVFRRKQGLNDSDILLSYFGFLRPEKKVELLLRATRKLLDRNCKVRLMALASIGDVVNGEAAYYEELRSLARHLGIEDRIVWMNYLSFQEVADYLGCSDICVLPFGSGVSEKRTSFISAISLGLPVITTKGPTGNSIPPDFRDHANMLLVMPDNVDQLVGAIIELSESNSLRRDIGAKAKELSQKFSWEQIVDKTLMVYKERR